MHVGGRLFQREQESVLRLYRHPVCVLDNVDLMLQVVRQDMHVLFQKADGFHTDRGFSLASDKDHVGRFFLYDLAATGTFQAGERLVRIVCRGAGKGGGCHHGNGVSAGPTCALQNTGMRQGTRCNIPAEPCFQRIVSHDAGHSLLHKRSPDFLTIYIKSLYQKNSFLSRKLKKHLCFSGI